MAEPIFQRTGECSWCGECCGNNGTDPPSGGSPWPEDWPDVLLSWIEEAWNQLVPFRSLIKRADLATMSGAINWKGFKRQWIFPPGESLCLDLPPLGDNTTFEARCPFLVIHRLDPSTSSPSDPATECGVADNETFLLYCQALPPETLPESKKLSWESSFIHCSYGWDLIGG